VIGGWWLVRTEPLMVAKLYLTNGGWYFCSRRALSQGGQFTSHRRGLAAGRERR
jgi:hypothetical protein